MSRDEVGLLLGGLSGASADPGLVEWMHRRTAGNPLFVIELHDLLGSRLGGRPPDRLMPPTAWLPRSIRDVLRGRLAQLTAPVVDVLEQAAVIGNEFDEQTLSTVTGVRLDGLAQLLESAVRGGVLVPDADRRVGFVFVHALMRDALYDELPAHDHDAANRSALSSAVLLSPAP